MKDVFRPLALATELGVTMGLITVASALAGLFLGTWVDRQLGTHPVATLLFILAGVSVGWLGTINLAMAALRRFRAAGSQLTQVRSAFSVPEMSRALALVVGMLLVTFLLVGLGLALGLWLDGLLSRRPLCTVLLLILAVAGSVVGNYWLARRAARYAGRSS